MKKIIFIISILFAIEIQAASLWLVNPSIDSLGTQSFKIYQSLSSEKFVEKYKLIKIDINKLQDGQEFQLDLFDNRTYTAIRNKFVERGEISFGWFGELKELEDSQVVLSVVDGELAGQIISSEGSYKISYVGDENYLLYKINSSGYLPEGHPMTKPKMSGESQKKKVKKKPMTDGIK